MKLAFCLFKYFPYGGLQRDFLQIAKACRDRGHEVHVFTESWEGDREPGLTVHLLSTKGLQNHTRNQSFAKKLHSQLTNTPADLVIGFNKLPGLDLYYAADVCYQARVREKHGVVYRLSPRYHALCAFEKAVFAKGSSTEIMLIAAKQQTDFMRYYQTEPERFHLLPPNVQPDRIAPSNASTLRAIFRTKHQFGAEELVLLMVGSGFKTKGLDRALIALAALPPTLRKHCRLIVIGKDNPRSFLKLAKQLSIAAQVTFLGGSHEVPQWLLAADLLLHPAYHENTGTVLLEAMVAGLPVLTIDVCGYAHYVANQQAGIVLSSPFNQQVLNQTLEKMLLSEKTVWQQNGLAFSQQLMRESLSEKAATLIEEVEKQRAIRT